MKRILFFALAVLALGSAAAAPAAAKSKKLPLGQARLDARIAMADYALDRDDLNYPERVKCVRKSRVRARCTGISTGEAERYTKRCDFVAVVTNKYTRLNYGGYWEAHARLTVKRCKETPKPYLTETAAVAAAQAEADRVAGGSTQITGNNILRQSDTEIVIYAAWSRPGEFGEEACELRIVATGNGGPVSLEVGEPFCF